MEIFLTVWNNWSLYQKITTSLMFISLLLIIVLTTRFITKSKKYTLLTLLSLIISAILTVLGFVFINVVFNTTISYIYMLSPIIILTINILNMATSIGFYIKNRKEKKLDLDKLRKEFLIDTTQLTIFLLLIFSAFSVFLTEPLLTFILFTGAISIAVPWINYALVYWLFKKNV